jgi:hypothetical protein
VCTNHGGGCFGGRGAAVLIADSSRDGRPSTLRGVLTAGEARYEFALRGTRCQPFSGPTLGSNFEFVDTTDEQATRHPTKSDHGVSPPTGFVSGCR